MRQRDDQPEEPISPHSSLEYWNNNSVIKERRKINVNESNPLAG